MRPLGIGKKSPVYRDECVPWLMRLSKAALADCVVDLLRGISDACDDPVSELTAVERITPVLEMRGDSIPKSEVVQLKRRIQRLKNDRIFNTALAIAKSER